MQQHNHCSSSPSTQALPWEENVVSTPFSKITIEVTQQELINLKHEAHSFKALFLRAQARVKERDKTIKQLREQHRLEFEAANKESNEKIAALEAKLHLREHQLFGKKSERKGYSKNESSHAGKDENKKRPRGQQRGKPGHGRREHNNLPVKEELIELTPDERCCANCGELYNDFAGDDDTEDSDILEIEVKAYKRRIRRKKYKKVCQCEKSPALLIAPKVNRLIPKGKLGISIWVEIILGKFNYYYPVNRRLRELADQGLGLSPGTVTDGLKKIKPLFNELYDALIEHNQGASHWNADETRWLVYAEKEGKKGYRWYLWLFRSKDSFVFQLDPSRKSAVPKAYFETAEGILNVDRYSAYKAMEKVTKICLAYCWAHVRRDFLDLAKKYPDYERWAMNWVSAIAKLYHLNNQRVACIGNKKRFFRKDRALRKSIKKMEKKFLKQLAKEDKKIPFVCKKVLTSLKNHWPGLLIFVDHPEVPMDNNLAENGLRGPVVLRKNSRGSGSEWSGLLAAMLFSLIETLKLWEINCKQWMTDYLQACADNGGKTPTDWKNFLPWEMTQERLSYFGGKSPVSKPSDNSS